MPHTPQQLKTGVGVGVGVDAGVGALLMLTRMLVLAGLECAIRVWDIASGQCVKIIEGHTDFVVGLAVCAVPNGRQTEEPSPKLMSVSHDNTMREWNHTHFTPPYELVPLAPRPLGGRIRKMDALKLSSLHSLEFFEELGKGHFATVVKGRVSLSCVCWSLVFLPSIPPYYFDVGMVGMLVVLLTRAFVLLWCVRVCSLGVGSFQRSPDDAPVSVAVKRLKPGADASSTLDEIEIMREMQSYGGHPNIIEMLGFDAGNVEKVLW